MVCVEVVDNIRSTVCPPTGDNSHNNIRPRPTKLKCHNLICVIIVPPTVRLPINRSSDPTVDPRSTFHDANLTIALPTTTEKTRGNNVAAFKTSASIDGWEIWYSRLLYIGSRYFLGIHLLAFHPSV